MSNEQEKNTLSGEADQVVSPEDQDKQEIINSWETASSEIVEAYKYNDVAVQYLPKRIRYLGFYLSKFLRSSSSKIQEEFCLVMAAEGYIEHLYSLYKIVEEKGIKVESVKGGILSAIFQSREMADKKSLFAAFCEVCPKQKDVKQRIAMIKATDSLETFHKSYARVGKLSSFYKDNVRHSLSFGWLLSLSIISKSSDI